MPKDSVFDADDVVLVVSAATSAITVLWGEFSSSPIIKVVRGVSVVVTFALTLRRIRKSKPFYKDVAPSDWIKSTEGYEISSPES